MTDKLAGKESLTPQPEWHYERLMREFEAWAYVRDFDITRSAREPQRYANERTQGAWQAWGHGTANWRDARDIAARLLIECENTLEMLADVAPAVSLRADIRKALGLEPSGIGGPIPEDRR